MRLRHGAARGELCQPGPFAGSLCGELDLLARRDGKIDGPVHVGVGDGGRRQAARETRQARVGGMVEGVPDPVEFGIIRRIGQGWAEAWSSRKPI